MTASSSRLHILAPQRYPWRFNGPRHSTHLVECRNFAPFNWLGKSLEGTTVFNPFPPRRFDLVHAFNRIPLGRTPFVIGFESHLPRAFRLERTAYFRWLSRLLADKRCRAIIAISEHARRIFQETHCSGPYARQLLDKLCVRYPNIDIPDDDDAMAHGVPEPITVAFVGNHFGRKGGCVAVEMAQNAAKRGIPLRVEIVSALQVGGAIWTDPKSRKFFDRYFSLLDLPNVRHHRSMSNQAVNDLFRRSHFSLLATFGDTFGFTALEAMANCTPVISTRQGALVEVIEHRRNGILLDLPTSSVGEWIHSSSTFRAGARFEKIFAEEVSRLAQEALGEIVAAVADAQAYQAMRRRAKETARRLFDSRPASAFWDDLYLRAVGTAGVGA